jgi:ssDNA-specific exonuclease RecJ
MTEKKTSKAQLKAVAKYKEKTKKMTLDFAPTEMELWEHIQKQPIPKQTYIKNLIRADMAKAD